MADDVISKQAKMVFETLCNTLDKEEWHYQKDEEELSIECKAQGKGLPMEITVSIYDSRNLIILISRLPFVTPESKRLDQAAAVSIVNYRLSDGSFDFDFKTGKMIFRITSSYRESLIGDELFSYMLYSSCFIMDKYNDNFYMLAKELITLDQFTELVNN